MKIIRVIFLVIIAFKGYCQEGHILKISISDLPGKVIYLADFYGDKNKVIDTSATTAAGTAVFAMKSNRPSGMYRIVLDRESFADVIYNQEDVAVATVATSPMDSLKVISSTENEVYYDFLHHDQEYQVKTGLLLQFIDFYPRKEKFYQEAVNEYINVQNEREEYVEAIVKKYPDSYSSKIVGLQQMPYIDPAMTETERLTYIRLHFFDLTDFNQISLLRSDVYTNKIINYLKLYSNRQLNQAQLEQQFKDAVDKILEAANKGNRLIYDYIVDYLTRGFEKFGFDKVNLHIAEKYKEQGCENEERKSDLQTRLENYQKLMDGKTAPEIEISDNKGNNITLANIATPYTVILFWASWCPHCATMLPEIKKMYQEQNPKKYEIIAISLDTDESEWNKALSKEDLPWINCCDFKSWNCKAAIDYNIYATPTMYILDKNRTIIAKPITTQQLQEAVKNLK